jgi:hypothetical protein
LWSAYQAEVVEQSGSRRIGRVKVVGGLKYLVIAEVPGQDFVCQAVVEVRNSKDVSKFGETVRQVAQTVGPVK